MWFWSCLWPRERSLRIIDTILDVSYTYRCRFHRWRFHHSTPWFRPRVGRPDRNRSQRWRNKQRRGTKMSTVEVSLFLEFSFFSFHPLGQLVQVMDMETQGLQKSPPVRLFEEKKRRLEEARIKAEVLSLVTGRGRIFWWLLALGCFFCREVLICLPKSSCELESMFCFNLYTCTPFAYPYLNVPFFSQEITTKYGPFYKVELHSPKSGVQSINQWMSHS